MCQLSYYCCIWRIITLMVDNLPPVKTLAQVRSLAIKWEFVVNNSLPVSSNLHSFVVRDSFLTSFSICFGNAETLPQKDIWWFIRLPCVNLCVFCIDIIQLVPNIFWIVGALLTYITIDFNLSYDFLIILNSLMKITRTEAVSNSSKMLYSCGIQGNCVC